MKTANIETAISNMETERYELREALKVLKAIKVELSKLPDLDDRFSLPLTRWSMSTHWNETPKYSLDCMIDLADLAWREQSKLLVQVRRAFGIKEWHRTTRSWDGSTYYTGDGPVFHVQLDCQSGGLPPSCKLVKVTEEKTETHTVTRYKTECE